jgi:hypothetical protein
MLDSVEAKQGDQLFNAREVKRLTIVRERFCWGFARARACHHLNRQIGERMEA